MDNVYYLTVDDVIQLHDDAVDAMNGPHSPLYESKRPEFESAVAKPRNLAHYEGADLITQAVHLAIGISQCQSFSDGNKRAAFAAADVFLRVNGLLYSGEPMDWARWLERVAEETDRRARASIVEELDTWIRLWIVPADDDE